jgi:hypothetical protein
VSVLLGNGDGTFQASPILTLFTSALPMALAAGHFNSDKNLDLALTVNSNSQGEVQILLGNGDGTFRWGETYSITPNSYSIIAADLRRNGKTDLVVGEFEGMGVAVLMGTGDGTFLQPVVYGPSVANIIAAHDMNGDGIPDLVASLDNVGQIGVFLGNGDGTFRAAVRYPVGDFPTGGVVADFNGDHLPDVAVAAQLSDREYTLLNTGVVAFSPTNGVTFKNQQHGTTSQPKTVTLTNTGATALTISSMKVTGQFGMTSTCGTTVAAGANCTLSVTFSPKSAGSKSGLVSILDSASSKPQVIGLSGTGT